MKTTSQERNSPHAVHRPISRIGRMGETARAPKPSTAASAEAVTGKNLLASAKR